MAQPKEHGTKKAKTENNFPLIPNALTAETIRQDRQGNGMSKAKDTADFMRRLEYGL